jgi:molecular chaperone GrpE
MPDTEPSASEPADVSESGPEATAPVDDWKDQYLRLAAEFDNFRKRSAREFGELVRNAERDLISDLTEVFDDFVRALEADHKGESVGHFAKGVEQIKSKFWRALEKRGLERLKTVGGKFNPEEQDALMRMPSEDYDEGTVVQEIAPGYKLGGKILRHAKVVVSSGTQQES